MKIIFRRWYLSGLLLLGILVYSISMSGVAKDGIDKKKMTDEELTEEEDKLRYMEQSTRAKHGRFILQGEVVDENGMRLNGVTLELEKVNLKNFGWETESDEEILTVNGTFQLDLKDYAAVRLYFSKDGYYSEKTDFPVTEVEIPEEIEEKIAEGKIVSEREFDKIVFKKEDIRIVLEKQGKLTHLIDYNGALEYTTSGKGIIINFDIPGGSLGTPRRRVDNIHDLKQLPENCVYMVADKDLDGKIATVRKKYYLTDGKTEMEYEVPQRIKLIMTAPESGFIEFKPDPNKKMPRQMKESPETGYQNELVIETDRFERGNREADICFYFKSKDKYGKGEIGTFGLYDDNSRVRIGVSFNLQPDGSRNLETGD